MPAIIITLFIGFILGFAIAKLTTEKQTAIGKSTQTQISAKQENKDRIIAYLKVPLRSEYRATENKKINSITNNEVEKLIKVSDATATRYL